MLADLETQGQRLAAISTELPIVMHHGESGMLALRLRDGRELVSPLPDDLTYDLWNRDGHADRFGLSLDEAREVAQ